MGILVRLKLATLVRTHGKVFGHKPRQDICTCTALSPHQLGFHPQIRPLDMESRIRSRSPSLQSIVTGVMPFNHFELRTDCPDIPQSYLGISGRELYFAIVGEGDSRPSTHGNILSSNQLSPSSDLPIASYFDYLPSNSLYSSTQTAAPLEHVSYAPSRPSGFSSDQQRLSSTTRDRSTRFEGDNISLLNDALSSSPISNSTGSHYATIHAPVFRKQSQKTAISDPLLSSSTQNSSNPEHAMEKDEIRNLSYKDDHSMSSQRHRVAATLDYHKGGDEDRHTKAGRKLSHNNVEKRYRSNINDSFSELRDSIPSLQFASASTRTAKDTNNRGKVYGPAPAKVVNKRTVRVSQDESILVLISDEILCKATEYIRHLEVCNSRLSEQNNAMQQKCAALESPRIAGMKSNSRHVL